MTQVLFAKTARETVSEILKLGLPEATAIVITTDAKTDALTARFIDKDTLSHLNTKPLCDILPGVTVHLFGLDDFPPETYIELGFLPVYQTQKESQDMDEINLSYFFKVNVNSVSMLPDQSTQRLSA